MGMTHLKLGNVFQLQRAVIRSKTEQSPDTFNHCALYECIVIECTRILFCFWPYHGSL